MTKQTKAGNPSPANRVELYTSRKTELIEEITSSVDAFVFRLIKELVLLVKDVVLDGKRIDRFSFTPAYLRWTVPAIQTAMGVRHPSVPDVVATNLRAVFKDLTGQLDVQGFSVDYDEAMGTWEVYFHEMDFVLALQNELGLNIVDPISVYFDIYQESPSVVMPALQLLDTEDVERYYDIFRRTWKPTLTWLQLRSSNDNLSE